LTEKDLICYVDNSLKITKRRKMMTTMLGHCPACGKLISVEAKSCPHCGLPITSERREQMIVAEDARIAAEKAETKRREAMNRREKEKKKKYPDTGDGR